MRINLLIHRIDMRTDKIAPLLELLSRYFRFVNQ